MSDKFQKKYEMYPFHYDFAINWAAFSLALLFWYIGLQVLTILVFIYLQFILISQLN